MLVRIANREDPDQTASSEAVRSGSAPFGRKQVFEILEHLPLHHTIYTYNCARPRPGIY